MLKKLLPLCLILTWLSLAIGWATPSLLRASSVQQQIEALIHEKEAAVNAKEKSRLDEVIKTAGEAVAQYIAGHAFNRLMHKYNQAASS